MPLTTYPFLFHTTIFFLLAIYQSFLSLYNSLLISTYCGSFSHLPYSYSVAHYTHISFFHVHCFSHYWDSAWNKDQPHLFTCTLPPELSLQTCPLSKTHSYTSLTLSINSLNSHDDNTCLPTCLTLSWWKLFLASRRFSLTPLYS